MKIVGWVFGLAILLESAGAGAQTIECGAVLGPGKYKLEADLECGTAHTGPAVTLDSATLDLNRHTIACGFTCALLIGRGSKLLNGAIVGGPHDSIVLRGEGRHQVKNITSSWADGNIFVYSDGNELVNVFASGHHGSAILLIGNQNRLVASTIHCRETDCVSVSGDGNRLVDNVVIVNTRAAFAVWGNSNILQSNRAMISDSPSGAPFYEYPVGITVHGVGNRIVRNTAIDTAPEQLNPDTYNIWDVTGTCTANTWIGNFARTRSPACLD